jgi:hypothetical protein
MRNSLLLKGLLATLLAGTFYGLVLLGGPALAQNAKTEKKTKAKTEKKTEKKAAKGTELQWPPKLPGGKDVITVTSDDFLKPPATLREGVKIAKTAPTVDFLYYPCQTYPGNIWSNWGDGLAVNGKYYSSIGDHKAPDGNAFVYEYDPASKVLRLLVDIVQLIKQMMGMYTPGKVHSRIDMGKDGWLYFSTHRGSGTVTKDDKYGFKGDWILRCDPKTGKSEVVAHGPIPKHCIPTGLLDPDRMIFYGGTAGGATPEVQFLVYDVTKRQVIYSCTEGPSRAMIFAKSTGNIYYVPGREDEVGEVVRFDPRKATDPVKIGVSLGLRAASEESPQGIVYTVSKSKGGGDSELFAFNTKTEKAEPLGNAAVGVNTYITTLDLDPSGRYLYYVPGAHGGSQKDNTAVVQYDTKTKTRKVIAFLHPHFEEKFGATLVGTYSVAVDPKGDKLYVTWNVSRGSRAWDSCALMVIHIPESERMP